VKLLFLASAGGSAMRRFLRSAIVVAAGANELRMLAPDAESKALRDCGIPTESWRPAGLFNVLRAISVLRRAVDRFEPDAIHAFGWTAAAVALGALPTRYARRTLVTLQDPIRKNEMPKTFTEKRLPELLARGWAVECAYETLRRVLVDTLGVPGKKVRVVPYAVGAAGFDGIVRPAGRPGPIVGYAGRLESDRAWEISIDAVARVRKQSPEARLVFERTGPLAGLVRSHARLSGIAGAVDFLDDLPPAEFLAKIDLLLVPGGFDGLPYALVESLVAGVPVIGADAGGVADTLAAYTGWLVPDDAVGFAAGIAEAWSGIDDAWRAAQAQRDITAAAFSPAVLDAQLLANYTRMAAEPVSDPAVALARSG
jgi:glycosyltransferase involved in cell wall biosynthesis